MIRISGKEVIWNFRNPLHRVLPRLWVARSLGLRTNRVCVTGSTTQHRPRFGESKTPAVAVKMSQLCLTQIDGGTLLPVRSCIENSLRFTDPAVDNVVRQPLLGSDASRRKLLFN